MHNSINDLNKLAPRESYKLLFPFGITFRRGQIYYMGADIDYWESFELTHNKLKEVLVMASTMTRHSDKDIQKEFENLYRKDR